MTFRTEQRDWLTAAESTVRSWCRGQRTTVLKIAGRSNVLVSVHLRRNRNVAIARLDFSCPWGCGPMSRNYLAHDLARRLKGCMAPGAVVGFDGLRKAKEAGR